MIPRKKPNVISSLPGGGRTPALRIGRNRSNRNIPIKKRCFGKLETFRKWARSSQKRFAFFQDDILFLLHSLGGIFSGRAARPTDEWEVIESKLTNQKVKITGLKNLNGERKFPCILGMGPKMHGMIIIILSGRKFFSVPFLSRKGTKIFQERWKNPFKKGGKNPQSATMR